MNSTSLQSVLDSAAGSSAALLERLGLVLYVGAAAIFVFVMCLALYAMYSEPKRIRTRRWIIGGGLIFPAVTLTALLVYSIFVGNAIAELDSGAATRSFLGRVAETAMPAESSKLRVHVVGKQWWWEVLYESPGGSERIVLANELHLPAGQAVEVLLYSTDVIHSFWAPSLAGKVDMIPGRVNRLVLRTDDVGVFRGQCAEYCGGQHALMAFFVVVEPAAQFNAWLARQAQPAAIPQEQHLKRGYDAFFRGRCDECHAIRGTSAIARSGPDLTHVGSRRSLAAGVLDNHIGTMAGWIAGAQDLKRGNAMPSMNVYSGEELRALSAWLGSLQ